MGKFINAVVNVCIGIGLNLDDLQTAPYSGIGRRIEVDSLGQKIETRLKLFLDHGFSIFQNEYESKLWRMGENAVLTIDGVENKIRILGVTERGLLKTEQKGELYLSDQGEILAPSKI
jgi:biotin-(acetyl-CoA carboxylase) ligase